MAEMKFLGFKEVTLAYFNTLTDTAKVGYLWFVNGSEAEAGGDIYLGARHYGHFGKDEANNITKVMEILSEAGIVEEDGDVLDVKGLLDVLNGDEETEGSVKNAVAEAVSGLLSGAPETFDTLRELADWIEKHGGEAADMLQSINDLEDRLDNLNTDEVKVAEGIVDENGNEVESGVTVSDVLQNIYDALAGVKTNIDNNKVIGGDYVYVQEGASGTTVSVDISTDEGNILRKGTDGGLFAGLYYECYDEDDLEATL